MIKANALYNHSLFRQFGGSTESISSSVMIFHPVKEPGHYEGIIYKNDIPAGSFVVDCSESNPESQADIDLSDFAPGMKTTQECCTESPQRIFRVKKEGYLLFFASKGTDGYSVMLSPASPPRERKSYFTKKPEHGDIALIMLVRPGAYQISTSERKSCNLSVEMPERIHNYHQLLQQPVTLTITEGGFDKDSITIAPGQGLVVHIEYGTSLYIKLQKPYDPAQESREEGSRFRWTKPETEDKGKEGKKKK